MKLGHVQKARDNSSSYTLWLYLLWLYLLWLDFRWLVILWLDLPHLPLTTYYLLLTTY